MRNHFCIGKQGAFGRGKVRLSKFAINDGSDSFVRRSLNPQEVCMAIDSIRTPIQVGDIRASISL